MKHLLSVGTENNYLPVLAGDFFFAAPLPQELRSAKKNVHGFALATSSFILTWKSGGQDFAVLRHYFSLTTLPLIRSSLQDPHQCFVLVHEKNVMISEGPG
jgi:hypothetical protein